MQIRLFYQNKGSETTLLKAIACSDETAFECLFHLYKDRIYSLANKVCHCSSTAEEIVQETFLIIWQRRTQLSEIEHFSAYILTIARNLVYKTLRAKAHQFLHLPESTMAFSCENTEMALLDKEHNEVLQKAVNRLPSQQQKVYILVKQNGMKREDAANVLKITPDTIKFHLAQAMKSIRAYCAGYLSSFFCLIFF